MTTSTVSLLQDDKIADGLNDENCKTDTNINGSDVRASMRSYWCDDNKTATIEAMLLDSQAALIDLVERPEILSLIPSCEDRRVLEIGAGIGRFTEIIKKSASAVVAVDFNSDACDENRLRNGSETVNVLCADATTLDFPENEFDFIFTNWLLMYFSDDEVASFAAKCLKWVKPGGFVFIRESCMHRSGDSSRNFNPTNYRNPDEYFKFFRVSDSQHRFQVAKHGRIQAYVSLKNNNNQLYWLFQNSPLLPTANAPSLTGQPLVIPSNAGSVLVVDFTSEGAPMSLLQNSSSFSALHLLARNPNEEVIRFFSNENASFELLLEDEFSCPGFFPNAFDVIVFRGLETAVENLMARMFLCKASKWLKNGGKLFGLEKATEFYEFLRFSGFTAEEENSTTVFTKKN
jgi:SAM-dependent methyltransferase